MHAKYEGSASYGSKVIANVKVDNRQTNKQTDRQADKQTDSKTDRTKTIRPDHSIQGHNKKYIYIFFKTYTVKHFLFTKIGSCE